MMQKLESRTVGLKPSKIGHMNRVIVALSLRIFNLDITVKVIVCCCNINFKAENGNNLIDVMLY